MSDIETTFEGLPLKNHCGEIYVYVPFAFYGLVQFYDSYL
jgi:hypothetical protein